eukprot:m51a1_g10125 putative uridine kinase (454) ;mRNA; r:80562-82400
MSASTKSFIEGRQPWYDNTGAIKQPLLIGVCGASASGKTALCREIIRELKLNWAIVIGMESFYRDLTDEQRANPASINFDCPDAFDWEEMVESLREMKQGRPASIRMYDYKNHRRTAQHRIAYGVDVILLEGILPYYHPEVAQMMDIKLFIDCDDDLRLARRLRRDIGERGRTVDQVLHNYEAHVKPGFAKYIAPLKKQADIIVPRGAENSVAVHVIVQQVQKMLADRGWAPVLRPITDETIPNNVIVLPDNPRMRSLQTFLRNRSTPHEEYVYHSDRLVSVLVEHALSTFPHKPVTIETPTGSKYEGEEFISKPCGVSIMKGGCAMEAPLRAICKGIRIGKILITSDDDTRCPKLIYVKLPALVSERHVLLLDTTLVSGATLMMAVHVLQDHGVKASNISFITLLATHNGIQEVSRMFPEMKIVAATVESVDFSDKGAILPGLMSHSDRYFG